MIDIDEESGSICLEPVLFDYSQDLSTQNITSIPCQICKWWHFERNDLITSLEYDFIVGQRLVWNTKTT